jgi:bacterial/archaeal transporter family-2 protein
LQATFILLAFLGGVALTIQVAFNTVISNIISSPIIAATITFVVGSIGLFIFLVIMQQPWPDLKSYTNIPWWAWTAGLLGAFYVAGAIIAAPKIGIATLFALVVAGQLLSALIIDHYGALGFDVQPVTLWKIAGAILIILGVVLIKLF